MIFSLFEIKNGKGDCSKVEKKGQEELPIKKPSQEVDLVSSQLGLETNHLKSIIGIHVQPHLAGLSGAF